MENPVNPAFILSQMQTRGTKSGTAENENAASPSIPNSNILKRIIHVELPAKNGNQVSRPFYNIGRGSISNI
jgi:hypothetical protein